MRVAVLGASRKQDRYSNRAFQMLREYGHEAIPVHPTLKELDGVSVCNSLAQIEGQVDTLTLYVGSRHIASEIEGIINLNPGQVIFNPGTESSELEAVLTEHGIPFLKACTLVLLSTGQFERVHAQQNVST